MTYYRGHQPITITRELTAGGEGRVCTINNHTQLLKIYHQPTPLHAAKLTAMITAPPSAAACAWPQAIVHDHHHRVVGFLMPRIASAVPACTLYNPTARWQTSYSFDWRYLVTAAMNLTSTVAALHDRGYVLGDVSHNNLLIKHDGTVVLIDCDSIQVPRRDHQGSFRCTVGTEEYTPPELFGVDFRTIERTPAHDHFGMAMLIFRLLMDGTHPFAGKWTGHGEPPSLSEKIRRGWYQCWDGPVQPPPSAPLFDLLPPDIRLLFTRSIVHGHQTPTRRSSATEWLSALSCLQASLVRCSENAHHWYSPHNTGCPWCLRALLVGVDTFPASSPASTVLARPFPIHGEYQRYVQRLMVERHQILRRRPDLNHPTPERTPLW